MYRTDLSGASLHKWRVGKGLTEAEAARHCGVSQTFWNLMESGKKKVPEHIVRAIREEPTAAERAKGRRGPYNKG